MALEMTHDTGTASWNATPLGRMSRRYRSLFLSDLHLGTSRSRPDLVLDFLEQNEAGMIYLVGDIFDGWNPKVPGRSAAHTALVGALIRRAENGTRIVLIPGNHDTHFRRNPGAVLGHIEIMSQAYHAGADGTRYLVTHGDCVDPLMLAGRHMAWFGSQCDVALRRFGRWLNRGLSRAGFAEIHAIEAVLIRVNAMLHPGEGHVQRLTARAAALGQDGVICGHFHIPALCVDNGVIYANCGDWLDHFSAIVEREDGALDLVAWRPQKAAQTGAFDLPEAELKLF